MENAPAVKTNEANLEELNKKIVEIKRKIVLKGAAINYFARPPLERERHTKFTV